jgi:hypothetical protein
MQILVMAELIPILRQITAPLLEQINSRAQNGEMISRSFVILGGTADQTKLILAKA